MATVPQTFIIDYRNRRLLTNMGSVAVAPRPAFVQGDTIVAEVHLVSIVDNFDDPTPETPIPAGATVRIAIGTPGQVAAAAAELSTALEENLGRTGILDTDTAEVEALLDGKDSVSTTLELEMIEPVEGGDPIVTTICRVPCTLLNDLITDDTVPPVSIASDIAELKAQAEADAAAADAARIAAEGHRDGAETAKLAAEGFRDDAETAKTEAETDAAAIADLIDTLDVPLPGAFPTDDQVMTGASPQAGVKGGVNCVGHDASTSGWGFPYTSASIELTLLMRVRPRWTAGQAQGDLAGTGSNQVGFGNPGAALSSNAILYLDSTGSFFGANTGKTLSELNLNWHSLAFVRTSAGVWSFYLNGSQLTNGASVPVDATTLNRLLAGRAGGYGQFQGDVADIREINRALTAADIKAVHRGEIPAELAQQSSAGTSWANSVGVYSAWTSFTSTGADNLSVSAAAGVNAACIIQLPSSKRGQYVRISGSVSSFSGTVNLAGTDSAANGSSSDVWSSISGAVSIGPNPWDLRVTGIGAFSARVFVPANGRAITVSNLNLAGAASFTGLSVVAEGTVAHFPGDQVSPENDWACSISGVVLKAGSGITALAPNPGIVRTARCTAADVSVSSGAEANTAFSAVSGDSVSANLLAALEAGYGCTWTPDTDMPDGLIHKRGVKITGAGAANLRVRNLTGGSLNTGAITGTLTIHIR